MLGCWDMCQSSLGTLGICSNAVRENPRMLGNVLEKFRSLEMCSNAVGEYENAVRVDLERLKFVPNEFKT